MATIFVVFALGVLGYGLTRVPWKLLLEIMLGFAMLLWQELKKLKEKRKTKRADSDNTENEEDKK